MQLTEALVRGAVAPIRIGLSASELTLEVALGIVRGVRRALQDGDGRLSDTSAPMGPRAVPVERRPAAGPAASERRRPATAPASPPGRRPEAVPPPPVPPAAAAGPAVAAVPPPPGAKRVDDTPVPVGEFGGKGAESAAGAQIHIDEPWKGYDGMTAAQIQKRLTRANRAAVAAVSLYEGSGRGRRSVLRAADRRLRTLSA